MIKARLPNSWIVACFEFSRARQAESTEIHSLFEHTIHTEVPVSEIRELTFKTKPATSNPVTVKQVIIWLVSDEDVLRQLRCELDWKKQRWQNPCETLAISLQVWCYTLIVFRITVTMVTRGLLDEDISLLTKRLVDLQWSTVSQ